MDRFTAEEKMAAVRSMLAERNRRLEDAEAATLVTAEQLHTAAGILDAEVPEGTPVMHRQVGEIAQFIDESNFTVRKDDGRLAGGFTPDPQSFGFGVLIGLLARPPEVTSEAHPADG